MHLNEGEFALSRDLMVDLWLQSRQYDKMSPLREVCGGDFVIFNDGLYESFMEFKKGVTYQNDLRIVEQVKLLSYWIKTCKITSIKEVSLMDKAYCLMSPADLDALCEWVYDTRKQWNNTEMKSCSPTQSKTYILLLISVCMHVLIYINIF